MSEDFSNRSSDKLVNGLSEDMDEIH